MLLLIFVNINESENIIVIKRFRLLARAENTLFNELDELDTELLHAELLSIEQLKRHAVTLAEQQQINPHPGASSVTATAEGKIYLAKTV